jgi:hypothetical protein
VFVLVKTATNPTNAGIKATLSFTNAKLQDLFFIAEQGKKKNEMLSNWL